MAPRKAAEQFKARTPQAASYRVTLYGSLAATGKGHFTDKAILDSLAPKEVELVWKPETFLPFHNNAMLFEALDNAGSVVDKWEIYSVGGGNLADQNTHFSQEHLYEHNNMTEILKYIERHGLTYWEYVLNHEGDDIWDFLNERWKGMYPIAWGESLVEIQFTSWLYNGVCGINQVARGGSEEKNQ